MANATPTNLVSDLDAIFHLLDGLPNILDVTKVTPPYVFRYAGKVPEDKGITGFVVIAESHISVHTFQEKGYAFIDVFSCKSFDREKAQAYVVQALVSRNVVSSWSTRGTHFPRYQVGG